MYIPNLLFRSDKKAAPRMHKARQAVEGARQLMFVFLLPIQ